MTYCEVGVLIDFDRIFIITIFYYNLTIPAKFSRLYNLVRIFGSCGPLGRSNILVRHALLRNYVFVPGNYIPVTPIFSKAIMMFNGCL